MANDKVKVVSGDKDSKPRKKTTCPVTREQFEEVAKPIEIVIDGKTITGEVKIFQSGSFGFFVNEKVSLMVGKESVKFQCNCNITAVGSKPKE